MPSWKRTLAVMVGAQFTSSLGLSFIFPILPFYIQGLRSSTNLSIEALAGLVFSVQALTMAIASPFWGVIADRYGRKPMVMRAMLGGAVVSGLLGFAGSVEQVIALRALQGTLTGVVAAASALVAAVCPRDRMGYAMGWLQVGLWGGHAAGPVLGGILSDLAGFRVTFLVTAGLLALSGVSVWLGVQEPFVRAEHLPPGGLTFLRDWRRVLTTGRIAVTLLQRFLLAVGRSTMGPVLPLFVLALAPASGRAGTFTGVIVGAEFAVSTLTAVSLGRLGDRVGHARVAFASAVFATVFYIPQALAQDVWQLLVLHAVTGVALGGLIPSLSALLARQSRAGDEGCAYGIDSSVAAAGRAVGPLLGAACAVWFSLRVAFLATSAVFALLTIVAARAVFPPRTGETPPTERQG